MGKNPYIESITRMVLTEKIPFLVNYQPDNSGNDTNGPFLVQQCVNKKNFYIICEGIYKGGMLHKLCCERVKK